MEFAYRSYRVASMACLVSAAIAGGARAWWPEGHSIIARAALRSLPAEVPEFFRKDPGLAAHCAQDPDVMKARETPALRDAEDPEHFIDWELLAGKALPPTRSEFVKLCQELRQSPKSVGTAPYAITEATERLTVAFAEHRRWPKNRYIRTKCLVYAGCLAHYAGDLCMPLHTTVHFDGHADAAGKSPRSGIHAKVDSLIERLELKPEELAKDQKPDAAAQVLPAVVTEMDHSRALIDRTYALEAQFPPAEGAWTASPEVRAFTLERARAATRFVASLYLTAWRKSADIKLPAWLKREGP